MKVLIYLMIIVAAFLLGSCENIAGGGRGYTPVPKATIVDEKQQAENEVTPPSLEGFIYQYGDDKEQAWGTPKDIEPACFIIVSYTFGIPTKYVVWESGKVEPTVYKKENDKWTVK